MKLPPHCLHCFGISLDFAVAMLSPFPSVQCGEGRASVTSVRALRYFIIYSVLFPRPDWHQRRFSHSETTAKTIAITGSTLLASSQ